jgi:hypothetical protein
MCSIWEISEPKGKDAEGLGIKLECYLNLVGSVFGHGI